MDMRQVTVFGGSGFVGRYVVRALAARGVRVRVAVRRPEQAAFLRTAGDVGQVVPLQANVRFPASVDAAVAGSDAVVNAVGIQFERGAQRFAAVHEAGARAIGEAAARAGIGRVVHVSGLGAEDRDSANRFVRSKALAEQAVSAAFPAATILRPSVVFGPEDRFFNAIAAAARLAPAMPVFGDGSAKFQPVYVADIAHATCRALADPKTAFSTFELGGPKVYTYRDLIALTLAQIGRTRPTVAIPLALARFGAFFAEFLPVPPLTRDQLDLLAKDNVVRPGAPGFAELGIVPVAAEAILPTYLDRYRIGGRYNAAAPA